MTAPDVTKRLADIRKRGGKVVVIDPRRTETAAVASEHHFIRPATDAALLMAMINTMREENLFRIAHPRAARRTRCRADAIAEHHAGDRGDDATGIDAGHDPPHRARIRGRAVGGLLRPRRHDAAGVRHAQRSG